jgi:hypothetical protein
LQFDIRASSYGSKTAAVAKGAEAWSGQRDIGCFKGIFLCLFEVVLEHRMPSFTRFQTFGFYGESSKLDMSEKPRECPVKEDARGASLLMAHTSQPMPALFVGSKGKIKNMSS